MTFNEIFFNKWMPVLLAGLISFITAWLFKAIEYNRSFKDKRVERADQTIASLSLYIENWRKLISISSLAKTRELSEVEKKRLERYVLNRDEAKEELSCSINTLALYFKKKVVYEARLFRSWDNEQSTKRLDELPSIHEWEKRGDRLAEILRKNI